MNWPLAFDDCPLRVILRLSDVLFNQSDALDQYALLFRQHLENLALGPTVITRGYLDLVALLHMKALPVHVKEPPERGTRFS